MIRDQLINTQNVPLDSLGFLFNQYTIDVLRLDKIHPVISGNKWYKLKEYLKEAIYLNKKIILTFGGAFSNHIVATAAAAKQHGFKSIGIVRGEKPATLSHTLMDAIKLGMKLYFVSRQDYKKKLIPSEVFVDHPEPEVYIINEGGYGQKGVEGARDILMHLNPSGYSHVVAAVGTGTTLAGLVLSTKSQQVIGISVLKNNYSLQTEIEQLIPKEHHDHFTLNHDYHFGGYAKYTRELIHFMNNWYERTNIPSDFVYTGKLFFAVSDLVQMNYFANGSKILVIHSGGLQGNHSLPKGTLIF